MKEFDFYRAKSLEDALKVLATHGEKAKIIAGGTDVMIDLRNGHLSDKIELMVDISGIEELKGIRQEDGMVHIGGAAVHEEIANDPVIRDKCLVLGPASGSVGSQQIRNRGTIAGNLVTAAQCADTAPALLVLEATVVLASVDGTRELPIADFFTGPKKTAVKPNELISTIVFPIPPEGMRGAFDKLIRREAVAKSRLGVCLLVEQQQDGKIKEARLSIGSSLPSHARYPTVEKMLTGKKPDEKLLHDAGQEAGEYLVSIGGYRWSTDYKMPVVQNLTERCLKRALEVD